MALLTVLEKLEIADEKNFLIQGLPSSIEKPFARINYAKSVTPLLRSRKIDFALVFAVNIKQLCGIIADVVPALHPEGKLWVAYPTVTSKIYSELSRDYNWESISCHGYEAVNQVSLDSLWTAISFKKKSAMNNRKTALKVRELETA